MKKQTLLLIIAVLVVTGIWLFHKTAVQTPHQQESMANAPTPTNPAIPVTASNSIPHHPTSISGTSNSNYPANPASPSDIAARYNQGLINKGEAMQEALTAENSKSLDMYGRIIDQYGQPVAGAKVEGSILLNVSVVSSGGESHFTETDSQGRFSFLGVHGVGIGIRPQKEGYIYDLKLPSQRPDNYQPDPNNPITFTMWKLRGAESLASFSIESTIPCDGTPSAFDMATQKKSLEGNLRVALSRSPLEVRRGKDIFDWNIKIEIPHGGLVTENDPYPYWAPESGYEPSFEFSVSSNNVPWRSKLTQSFYIKNDRGQFGRMQVNVYTALTPARIQFDLQVNSSGSQNLEPSPSK